MESNVPPLSHRLAASVSFSVLTTIGTLADSLLLYILYKHQDKYHKKHNFYILTWCLAVGDLGAFVTHLVVAVPLSITGRPLYGDGWLLVALASFETLFFCVCHLVTFFIALNRMCIFVSDRMHDILFEGKGVYYFAVSAWMISACWTGLATAAGHHKKFNHDHFHFYYENNFTEAQEEFNEVTKLDVAYSIVLNAFLARIPIASLVAYCAAYLSLKSFRKGMSDNSFEKKLMLQGFIIALVTQIEVMLFDFGPEVVNLTYKYFNSYLLGGLLISNVVIINHAINPFIYFIFNKTIQKHMLEHVGLKKKSQTTTRVKVINKNIVNK